MDFQERKSCFLKALSQMRDNLPEEEVKKRSQQVRSSWLRNEAEGKSPKQLGQEAGALDALAPLIALMTSTIHQDPDLVARFYNRKDPRPFEERIYETAVRCFLEVEKGVALEQDQIRSIAEQVIAQEPLPIDTPKEVIAFLERLKERGQE